ncbi:hypothetical protein BP6252_01086 [Coleophoma cylindrospora]|uniref:Uncharacterized protein n=1 Tax=Coleophoma cylindrospora TaxID=1849047 RepID=A0A3D8SS49_9HELO|nr:hypothetical protein BP6252_01086 [Coleophoma cylindrospora]
MAPRLHDMEFDYPQRVFPPVYSFPSHTSSSTYMSSHPPAAITLRSGRRLPPRGGAMAGMETLPTEMLEMILMWDIRMCRSEKNTVLPLRMVCKAFDRALRPYIFKTMQLEFSRFARDKTALDPTAVGRVGDLCNALYIDMMVIRDDEEINRLSQIFQGIIGKVPEMTTLLNSLRKYCMNENTFDETDFKRVTDVVLQSTPHMTRLKVNLPFQVVGLASQTATLLLANTLAAVTQRPSEYSRIETLVLDHVSDTTINTIAHNPNDLQNAVFVFSALKHLVLSIKRQEGRTAGMTRFVTHLWYLIRRATKLETLCVIGWNVKRDGKTRLHRPSVTFNEWMMRSFPYDISSERLRWDNLRCLELKRVDIDPLALESLVESVQYSLKELYLNEVYLKVFGSSDRERTSLWIGHGATVQKPDRCIWLADNLRNMEGLNLEVLRATGLGYDDFDPDKTSAFPNYDLDDPKKLDRSFDQRFVEAVFGLDIDMMDTPSPTAAVIAPAMGDITISSVTDIDMTGTASSAITSSAGDATRDECSHSVLRARRTGPHRVHKIRTKIDYDAETYQRYRNVTSHFKRCIDGWFTNHNEQALKELQKIITVADRGMALLTEEIERTHALARDAMGGPTASAMGP